MIVSGAIIGEMGTENPCFRKILKPGPTKDVLKIETEGEVSGIIKDLSREKTIPADLLDNLKSLAVMAEADPASSSDQEWLNKSLNKLRKKFPTEQPKEVWRRTLATLMAEWVDTESIATTLLSTNDEFRVRKGLGDMSETEKGDRIKNLKDAILEFWSSSRNLA